MSYWHDRIHPAGVVLAILFIWVCLLGLLFLLWRDRKMVGYIQVTVQGSGFYHSTMIPALGAGSMMVVTQEVNYARAQAAAA
jgi:hypothetical protein